MKIVLLGYMGSGKSTIGKQLSLKLGYIFKDLDEEIEIQERKSIPEIFSEKGEIYFRKKENKVLKEILDTKENLILATGGGTPCYGDVLPYLKNNTNCITVYLKASLEILTHRLFKEKDSRPLIAHIKDEEALNDFIRKHLFERAFYYNQADKSVLINNDEKEVVVENIIAKLF